MYQVHILNARFCRNGSAVFHDDALLVRSVSCEKHQAPLVIPLTLFDFILFWFLDSCYYGDGQLYRGNVSETLSSYTCQSWSSQCPHRHHRTPNNFPELKKAGNACRNPGGQAPHGPWCYTINPKVRWEYCYVEECEQPIKHWKVCCSFFLYCSPFWDRNQVSINVFKAQHDITYHAVKIWFAGEESCLHGKLDLFLLYNRSLHRSFVKILPIHQVRQSLAISFICQVFTLSLLKFSNFLGS